MSVPGSFPTLEVKPWFQPVASSWYWTRFGPTEASEAPFGARRAIGGEAGNRTIATTRVARGSRGKFDSQHHETWKWTRLLPRER